MHIAFGAASGVCLLLPALQPASTSLGDRVIHAGETVVYDTSNGPLGLDNLEIQAGGVLRAVGSNALRIYARESITIDGLLDLSGFDHPGVFTLNTPNQPELGAAGGPGGGQGGTASRQTQVVTPLGSSGENIQGALTGGGGGESGWSDNSSSSGVHRRAAGGGGGVFGPAELVVPRVFDEANAGRVALPGREGAPMAIGAISLTQQPQGGAIGSPVFSDVSGANDFFGRKAQGGGSPIVGELLVPRGGQGGGGGGDATFVPTGSSYPPPSLVFSHQDKGGAGGGGGGLGVLISREISLGPEGRIVADGGAGGAGENTIAFNRIGGGGGGGSGGMIALQAEMIDLSQASTESLSALGGMGGAGANDAHRAEGAGGQGGPGLIQLHVPNGDESHVLLPVGVGLSEVSAPKAHVLLVEASL